MNTEIKSQYLRLCYDQDPKQQELGIRILDLYERSVLLGLEVRWPDPPLKEKIVSLIDTNLRFQMEALLELIDIYQNTDPMKVMFLAPPYNKRNIQKFTKLCKAHSVLTQESTRKTQLSERSFGENPRAARTDAQSKDRYRG